MNKKILYILSVLFVFALVGATGVYADERSDDEESDNATSSIGEQHRSRVADFAEELEKIDDKDDAVENEIKTIAREEKDTSERVKEKMDKVEKRNGFKIFLIGSDYKNLGALRSELVSTENRLNRLNKALAKTTSSSTQAELQTQIDELTTIKTEADSFVKDNESKFSLLGWLVRMFNR
ncbi:MAG: hypothetical protein WC631_01295 [Candidatus Paceibacterota bacterium]|jgi:Mg2+ and Co2+ transporter CorA